jgi:hypothetical protein
MAEPSFNPRYSGSTYIFYIAWIESKTTESKTMYIISSKKEVARASFFLPYGPKDTYAFPFLCDYAMWGFYIRAYLGLFR